MTVIPDPHGGLRAQDEERLSLDDMEAINALLDEALGSTASDEITLSALSPAKRKSVKRTLDRLAARSDLEEASAPHNNANSDLPACTQSTPQDLPACTQSASGELPACTQIKSLDLPACTQAPSNEYIEVNAKKPAKRAKQVRISRSADALLIEAKRALQAPKSIGFLAARSSREMGASGENPIVNVTTTLSPSLHDTHPQSSDTHELDESDDDSDEEVTAFKNPWWKDTALRADKPLVARRCPPQYRHLGSEALLDLSYDAMLEIAASNKSGTKLAVYAVDINLDYKIERDARRQPKALEWVKYRIQERWALPELPCSFVMIAEDANVKEAGWSKRTSNLTHEEWLVSRTWLEPRAARLQHGLPPLHRLHIHSLQILPQNPGKRAIFKKGLLKAVGDQKLASQIKIKLVRDHGRVDYMAKDLWKDLKRPELQHPYTGTPGYLLGRSYRGPSVTLSTDVRVAQITCYERFKEKLKN